MEQVQRVVVEISGAPSVGLIRDLETHRNVARQRAGFRSLTIARSTNEAGNTVLQVETRWRDNNTLVDYSLTPPNVEAILRAYNDETVQGTLQITQLEAVGEAEPETTPGFERVSFALVVPAGVFLFGLLIIYVMSRIYLSASPHAATAIAAIVAIGILAVGAFIASAQVIQRWQVATVVVAVAVLLLVGGIYAGSNGRYEVTATSEKTPVASQTSSAPVPQVTVVGTRLDITTPTDIEYDRKQLTAKAGEQVTVVYDNKSDIIHNIDFFNGPDAKSPSLAKTKLGKSTVETVTFTVPTAPGSYFFHCDAHPTQMTGTLVVQ
ncbi:MAG TPA: cupredoxin domain-containing protein [Dehalococcoidia bacterium]|nr:cupredoxin domain-containing protein [Dehalococcoidia bacterium]